MNSPDGFTVASTLPGFWARFLLRIIALFRKLIVFCAAVGMTAVLPAQQSVPPVVAQALRNELAGAQDFSHPMRYVLRKSSPRLTTTKAMVETKDGLVAMLLSVNDAALSAEDAQKEKARLDDLLANPDKQEHRKKSEDVDTERAMKILRALPKAFLYKDAGPGSAASGAVERFTFTPDPKFDSSDLETTVLTQMSGELWIDPVHQRVVRLVGQLDKDVDFGWGVLGRLYKGGSIVIEQADVGDGVWRIVRFKMAMNGRVLFKTRSFDTTEEESHFAPVKAGMDYKQGIQMLRAGQSGAGTAMR